MLVIKIDTDGAAFRDIDDENFLDPSGIEVNRLLDVIKQRITDGGRSGEVIDVNGNLCGEWEYK